jgi:hypothetical protein
MSGQRSKLTSGELNESLNGRVSLDSNIASTNILMVDREVELELIISTILYAGDNRPFIKNIIFSNCVFKNRVIIGNHRTAGNITFDNCIFEASSHFESLDNVSFEGINSFLDYVQMRKETRDVVENIAVAKNLVIEGTGGLNVRNINSQTTELKGDVSILGSFENVVFQDLRIGDLDIRNNLGHEISLNRVELNCIYLSPLTEGGILRIWKSNLNQLITPLAESYKSSLEIGKDSFVRNLVFAMQAFTKFVCENSTVGILDLLGENGTNHAVGISNVQVETLIFRDLRNNGTMSFNEVHLSKDGRLIMKRSNLGKTDFVLCDFSPGKFEFQNSKIMEAFMAESEFPKFVAVDGVRSDLQAQLAFGQISSAFQKQGDTVRSLEYQSREIEAHYRALKWMPHGVWSISFTKFNLLLNKISNDFGRNWVRGILFTFGVGILFYYGLIISSKEYHIGPGSSWDERIITSFLKFMNPLRFFETENLFKADNNRTYLTLTPWSYFIDFVSRVFIAYGSYQTIQAFRRFGRK